MKYTIIARLFGMVMLLFIPSLSPGQDAVSEFGLGSVRGVVRDEKNQPVAGIKVRAISRRTDQQAGEVMTDSYGQYEFSKLPVGRYALSFFSPEHRTATVPVVEVRRQETSAIKDVTMVRAKPFAIVAGSTFNADGFVLVGTHVRIERVPFDSEPIKSMKMEQHSNSTGEFAFRLPAERARFRITATAPGHEVETAYVEIDGAERRNLAVRLQLKK
ncbi:MAG: carboxypeptidase regulatory-like domain-containing protein [Acidobacteria bacterium]|nr:carboxypeptidase regulatory-like domain-containing protein [Acidobacteriota bacterium]